VELTEQEIKDTLDYLHIDRTSKVNGNWLLIRCPIPGHNDKNISNCGIDLQTGVINCFACKESSNIVSIVKDRLNLSYIDALKFIKKENFIGKNVNSPNFNLKNKNRADRISKNVINKNKIENLKLEDFNPEDYSYTRMRGFTKEFCKKFNIQKCMHGWYKDYFIIPIIDKEKKINTFEARKLNQFELKKALLVSDDTLDDLIKDKKLVIKDFRVYSEVEKKYYNNSILLYFLKPKVLYPKGIQQNKRTLFNIDNLNYNKDLWISEGIGTIPKIYDNISKNVSCTFGTEITEEQIEYLNKFNKKKIIIPDNDKASLLMIEALNMQIKDLYVIDIKSNDTSKSFIDNINNSSIVLAVKYLFNKYKLFE